MNKTTDLEKPQAFDPAAAVNAIRDKIRGQMLDVVPTEQWNALIQAEMQAFMHDTVKKNYYGNEEVKTSGFKQIVRSLLEEDAREHVRAFLRSPEWQGQFSPEAGEREAGVAVRAYITEKGPEILRACMNEVISNAVQSVLEGMRNKL